MSGGNKPYYDRDDLDEDEKKLFDAMVLEEMEKLEKQFDASSLAPSLHDRREREGERDHNRDNKPPQLQINSSGGYRGDARDERSYTRDRPSNEPLSPVKYPSECRNSYLLPGEQEQPARRAPRSVVVAENYPHPSQSHNNGMPFTPEKSTADKRLAQQEYARLLEEGSRAPIEEPTSHAVRRIRRDESPPTPRFESNISRIGAGDLTMVSPSQKRAQQAKYAQQLAEGSSRPQSFRDDPYKDPYKNNDDGKAKPRRRQSVEVTIEDVNVISNIGQDSQVMKDQKKLQQQEYAQQLQSQQQQKQRQDSAPANPYISSTPRGQISPGANPYSARGNHTDSYNSSSPPSKSSVANFGPDPNAEAARKREMKVEYARQLQEQQHHKERSSPRSGYREPPEQDRGSQRPMSMREYGADESKDDRGKSLSAAEMKRIQQRQYHDEITMAAAAPAIYSERAPLKGSGQQRMQGDGYDLRNGPGTGLQLQIGGNASSFLSSADAERLHAKSRKVELQQQYAKQLSDDATVNEMPSRHASANSGGRAQDSYRTGSGYGGDKYSLKGSVGGDDTRGGMFGNQSERGQAAADIDKKRAAQAEYFQQLQEGQRSGTNSTPSSRHTLYRSREQREMDVPAIGSRGTESNSSRQRPQSDYRSDHGDGNGYQGQGYSLAAGPGYDQPSHSQPRNTVERETQTARRREQDEYARALRSDSEVIPIAETYTAQRRSHHDREGPGSGSASRGGERDGGYSRDAQQEQTQTARRREQDEYARALRSDSEVIPIAETYTAQRRSHHDREGPGSGSASRGGERDGGYSRDAQQEGHTERYTERYPAREREREPEMRSDSRSQQFRDPERYPDRDDRPQPRYQDREERVEPRYQDRERVERVERVERSNGYDDRSRSGVDKGTSGGHVSNNNGLGGYYDDDGSQYESQRRAHMSSPYSDRSARSGSEPEPLSPGQQYKRQHLFGADPNGTVTRQQGSLFQPDNADVGTGNVSKGKAEDYRGRGRSSGGGASTISLYG